MSTVRDRGVIPVRLHGTPNGGFRIGFHRRAESPAVPLVPLSEPQSRDRGQRTLTRVPVIPPINQVNSWSACLDLGDSYVPRFRVIWCNHSR